MSPSYKPKQNRVTAEQWHPGVDHPRVVRCDHGIAKCPRCGHPYNRHGYLESREGGGLVCPGNYVVYDGEYRIMTEAEFKARFVEVDE